MQQLYMMKSIAFASSNAEKLAIAQVVCRPAGIEVVQIAMDIDEIQGENPEIIVKDKAQRAYEQYGKPIVSVTTVGLSRH
jgi:inosine/xanthosine triphosphate pyrophosphatase family protein